MTAGPHDPAPQADAAAAGQQPKPSPQANPVRRWALVVTIACVVLFGYSLISDRLTPYTAQSTLQAFVVGVAPEVSGRVSEVNVIDNQVVRAGEVLFRIDVAPYQIAVERADAQLAVVGQSIGANTAGVGAAEQEVAQASANLENIRQQTARIFELVKTGVYAQARGDKATAELEGAKAAHRQAQAELERARQELGPQGADNPQVREASAALQEAQLDLARTSALAPSDGVITNLQLSVGQYVSIGQRAMTFIDARSIWVIANFRENNLELISPDAPVELVFDVLPGQIFGGRVESIGWGVAQGGLDPTTGLPTIRNQSGWIRDPQRFPVRIDLDHEGYVPGLRYGSQVNVIVYTDDNPIVNGLGWLWIRIVGILTYVT